MIYTKLLLLAFVLAVLGCDGRPEPSTNTAALTAQHLQVGEANKGKTLAADQCAECHGIDGVKADSGAPFIAGMAQDYMVRSLLAYGNGARNHAPMKTAVDKLDPWALANVSAYYANLDSVWQGAVADQSSRAVLQDSQARAKAQSLISSCISCHSLAGRHQQAEVVPNLDGMPLEYFVPALKSYFNGGRNNAIMALFKGRLSDEDIYNIGAYFAARTPAKGKVFDVGNARHGKTAAKACAGCHGYDGNSLNPNIPNLAGQPQNYLVKAIKDYRDGLRQRPLMRGAVANLNDATIDDLAAYFARQQPESPLHKDISSEQAFNPLADGEKIALVCNTCHGNRGNNQLPHMPSLAGMHVKYLVSAMQDYQQGVRKHDAMNDVVSFFSDTDIEKVAYYYAVQPPESRQSKQNTNVERGRVLSRSCAMCHSQTDAVMTPSLAGQGAAYIVDATKAYATGGRQNEQMKEIAGKLNDNDLSDIADFFAKQTPTSALTYLPDDPAKLIEERCARCHGERGYSQQAGVPRLAGQLESYLVLSLKEYQDGVRKNATMVAMADVLSLLEIKAISAYYAKQ